MRWYEHFWRMNRENLNKQRMRTCGKTKIDREGWLSDDPHKVETSQEDILDTVHFLNMGKVLNAYKA